MLFVVLILSALCSLAVAAPHVDNAARAAITPAPVAIQWQERAADDSIDPISLAQVLLTAVPQSLRELAATNIPAASRVLWSEFLDGHTPSWFGALPTDIQEYLSEQFGPHTASVSTTRSQSVTSSSLSTASASSTGSSSLASSSISTASADTVSATNSLSLAQPTTSDAPNHHGLSAGAKIGLGVGIPLAIALIAAILIGCCLVRRRRKRRTQGMREDSRPPTPAFISSSFQRTPGGYGGFAGNNNRGGSEKYDAIVTTQAYHDASGRQIAPVPVPGNGNGRQAHHSVGSLHSVPEEETDADAIGALSRTRGLRRSRNSISNGYGDPASHDANANPFSDRNRSSYVPVPSPTAGTFNPHGANHSPEPDITAHPAYRNQTSFSTPSGPYQNGDLNRRSLNSNVGGYAAPVSKPLLNGHAVEPEAVIQPATTTEISSPNSPYNSPKRKSLSGNPFKKEYWKPQTYRRPGSDYGMMYEGT